MKKTTKPYAPKSNREKYNEMMDSLPEYCKKIMPDFIEVYPDEATEEEKEKEKEKIENNKIF